MATVQSPATTSAWSIVESTGELVVLRHSGSSTPVPEDWPRRLAAPILAIHGVAIAGAKRLSRAKPDGGSASRRIHSMGEFVVHPKGFHSLGRGVSAEAFRFPEEVDAVTGGVIAVSRAMFDALGGERAFHGSLGTLSACIEARRRGGRVLVVPDVTVEDDSILECTEAGDRALSLRLGFEWRAADLDDVRRLHAGSGLLWNPRFFCGDIRYTKYESRPALHWKAYDETPVYRSRADAIVKFIAEALKAPGSARGSSTGSPSLLDLGCGDGLFSHLLSQRGLAVRGIDIERAAIDQARQMTSTRTYAAPGRAPAFTRIDSGPLPFESGSFDAATMIDVIEHLPNPVAVLREVRRVLVPGGVLAVVTPEWQFGAWSDPLFHVCEYTMDELTSQLRANGFAPMQGGRVGQPYRDVIVLARNA